MAPRQRAVTLDLANKDYTFSLSIVGNTLFGSVTEVGGGVVAFQQKTDLTSPFTSGFSGVFGLAGRTTVVPLITAPLDYTVDKFSATAIPEPATGLLAVVRSRGRPFVNSDGALAKHLIASTYRPVLRPCCEELALVIGADIHAKSTSAIPMLPRSMLSNGPAPGVLTQPVPIRLSGIET